MSKIKKKKMKQPAMRLRTLAASLMMMAIPLSVANNQKTTFSPYPLIGVTETFAPHIALALSVEFPTAGAAYSENAFLSLTGAENSSPMTQTYLGYFDNTKCYVYDHTNGYFKPSSKAVNESGYYGLCNTGGDKEEFSGNMMNFMTMTALDIFRSTMTGGNRALGASIESSAYVNGDTVNETFLRRAKVQYDQNGGAPYKISDRQLGMLNAKRQGTYDILKRLMPHYFVDVLGKDSIEGQSIVGRTDNSNGAYGRPASMGFRAVPYGFQASWSSGPVVTTDNLILAPAQTVTQNINDPAGAFDKFATSRLHFFNDGFQLHIVRKVAKGMKRDLVANGRVISAQYSGPQTTSELGLYRPDGVPAEYYAVLDPAKVDSQHRAAAEKWGKKLNVVVKVCDPNVSLEENCQSYGNNYKPEGLLQQYTKSNGMRFATFGYLNQNDYNSVHGGVLRSRMKKLIGDEKLAGETYSTVYGDEWDTNTGILKLNPDTTDAEASGVPNSGTINYLNKFGDRSGYKAYDPAGELYETALAYLRGTNVNKGLYKPADSILTQATKDNFPAIYDWDDPYKRGIDPRVQHCHANSIIFIGDTNTHADNSVISANPKAATYLPRLFTHEGIGELPTDTNFGSTNSPAYMAGLAYWARTNNIRPDLPMTSERPINGNNFIIDVVEQGMYRADPMRNTYYLAAKYGGFNIEEKNRKFDLIQNGDNNKPLPIKRDSWTDDGARSSIAQFPNGVPRNFAIANNPAAMKAALGKAIASGAALNNPSQAATGLSVNAGGTLDFSNGQKPITLQSTYNFAGLSGDVVAYETSYRRSGNELFETKEIWRASTSLNSQYHNNTAYVSRKVFTTAPGQNSAIDFKAVNANAIFAGMSMPVSATATDLVNYVLGDNSKEGNGLRQRGSLMGTVVNSTVHPITPVTGNLRTCSYRDLDKAKNRGMHYAAASNNGLLHIFELKTIPDGTEANGTPKFRYEGSEKMAYMAGTALPKLPDFASPQYTHKYLNDGTPQVTELCLTNGATTEARSVLLGSAGRGGQSVYALDVTDLSAPNTNNVLWEFTHDDLGYTISSPVITQSPDGRALAIVSSGYNNSSDVGHIFILDISKPIGSPWVENTNFWKVELGANGVGAPFVYDGNQDGVGDKIFVGDVAGNLWQLNRTADTGVQWAIPAQYAGKPLFEPSSATARPISGAPYAEMVNGQLIVAAATGQYLSEKDLNSTQQNYAYGFIVDEKRAGGVVQENTLLSQEVVEDVTKDTALAGSNIKVYTITEKEMAPENQGWRLTLLPGQNVAKEATIRKRQVAEFTAVRMSDAINATCQRSGSTSYISVDVKNGGLNKKPIFDTNRDGAHDANDKSVAIYEVNGMTTSQSTFVNVRLPDQSTRNIVRGTDGNVTSDFDVNKLDNDVGVRRISWREIF